MIAVWAQRQEELLSDCVVSPHVFAHMVDRLGDFFVPYVRRDSSLHIATQVDWNSKECSRGQPPYLTSKGRGEHSMAEKRKAKRRRRNRRSARPAWYGESCTASSPVPSWVLRRPVARAPHDDAPHARDMIGVANHREMGTRNLRGENRG